MYLLPVSSYLIEFNNFYFWERLEIKLIYRILFVINFSLRLNVGKPEILEHVKEYTEKNIKTIKKHLFDGYYV